MIQGEIKLNRIIYVVVPAMIATTLFCYYMAVKYHEQKPFPYATVTATASHYPQDIVFRFVMLIFSSTLALLFYTVVRWMDKKAERAGFEKIPRYYLYSGMFSIFCYCVTIGTIDEVGRGKWHGPCAVTFFVIWVVAIINITVYLTKLRNWDTSSLSLRSLTIKQLLAMYLMLVWLYCMYNLTTKPYHTNKENPYVVIV